jgi:hypothetical protein
LSAASADASPRRRSLVILLVVILATAGIVYLAATDSSEDAPVQPTLDGSRPQRTEASPAALARQQVRLGMTPAQVRAIEGEPMTANPAVWEFGPSWIAFECGEVSDWYSSPLHPLKVAATHAQRLAADARQSGTHCRQWLPARLAGHSGWFRIAGAHRAPRVRNGGVLA